MLLLRGDVRGQVAARVAPGQARGVRTAAVILLIVLLVISGWRPYDRLTWLMEVAPVLVGLPLVVAVNRPFPLTSILCACLFALACVLMLGGAYTYARVPFGFGLQGWLQLDRNPYDRIAHLMQGFVPAMLVREILIRGNFVRRSLALPVLVLSAALAISASYELVEWLAAVLLGAAADDFLGTQGDPWDTHWDMFCALIGAIAAQLLLSRWHDRQLGRLPR